MLGGLGRAMQFSVMFRALDQFTGPVSRMGAQVRGLQADMQRAQRVRALAGEFGKVSAASAGLAAGIAGLAAVIVGDGALEDALAAAETVWTPVNESMDDSIAKLADSAYKWSSIHKQSALEFVQAAYQMGSAGLNAEQAIAGTRAALGLATAAFGAPTEAANLLAVAYNTLGDKSRPVEAEMGRIADVLARTQQLFQISDLNQLGEGLKYAIPSAQGARQSLEDVAASVGQLNTLGLQGSMAGTAYSTLVGNLGRAGKQLGLYWPTLANGAIDVVGAVAAIRNQFGDLSQASAAVQDELKGAFGEEGYRALMLLSNATGQWKAGLDALGKASGTVEKTMKILERTPNSKWQVFRNKIDNTVDVLGDKLQPVMDRVQDSLLKAAETVEAWARANPDTVQWAADVLVWGAAIFAGVSAVTGLVAVALWWWATWTKVYLIGKVLATFLTGRLWGAIQTVGRALWAALVFGAKAAWAGLKSIALGLVAVTKRLWALAAGAVRAGLAFLATPVGWLTMALVGLGAAIYNVVTAWDDLTGQTNKAVHLPAHMVQMIRENAKLRQSYIDKALGGDESARDILNVAMSDTFDDGFWKTADKQKKAKNQAALAQSMGLDLAPGIGLAVDDTGAAAQKAALMEQATSLGMGDFASGPSMPDVPGMDFPEFVEPPEMPASPPWDSEGPPLRPDSVLAPSALSATEMAEALAGPMPDVKNKSAVSVGNLTVTITVNEAIDEEKLMKIVERRLTEALGGLGMSIA